MRSDPLIQICGRGALCAPQAVIPRDGRNHNFATLRMDLLDAEGPVYLYAFKFRKTFRSTFSIVGGYYKQKDEWGVSVQLSYTFSGPCPPLFQFLPLFSIFPFGCILIRA